MLNTLTVIGLALVVFVCFEALAVRFVKPRLLEWALRRRRAGRQRDIGGHIVKSLELAALEDELIRTRRMASGEVVARKIVVVGAPADPPQPYVILAALAAYDVPQDIETLRSDGEPLLEVAVDLAQPDERMIAVTVFGKTRYFSLHAIFADLEKFLDYLQSLLHSMRQRRRLVGT